MRSISKSCAVVSCMVTCGGWGQVTGNLRRRQLIARGQDVPQRQQRPVRLWWWEQRAEPEGCTPGAARPEPPDAGQCGADYVSRRPGRDRQGWQAADGQREPAGYSGGEDWREEGEVAGWEGGWGCGDDKAIQESGLEPVCV
jgi:hypothetical protein